MRDLCWAFGRLLCGLFSPRVTHSCPIYFSSIVGFTSGFPHLAHHSAVHPVRDWPCFCGPKGSHWRPTHQLRQVQPGSWQVAGVNAGLLSLRTLRHREAAKLRTNSSAINVEKKPTHLAHLLTHVHLPPATPRNKRRPVLAVILILQPSPLTDDWSPIPIHLLITVLFTTLTF